MAAPSDSSYKKAKEAVRNNLLDTAMYHMLNIVEELRDEVAELRAEKKVSKKTGKKTAKKTASITEANEE
jgi:hypothetical protein